MTRKNRSPEENARRAKIRELLLSSNISSMDDIQDLFKETIAEFMESGVLRQSWMTSWATDGTTIETKIPTTAATGTAAKRFEPATAMWR